MQNKDKVFDDLRKSKCERGYKNKHYWERRGIFKDGEEIYCVWQCTQCEMCILEELKFINTFTKGVE